MARKKKTKPEIPITTKAFKWLWLIMGVGILFSIALMLLISFTKMPDTEELENPKFEVSTIIYDDVYDGKAEEIGRYFKLNREWLTFEELNPHIVNALVATEDERFFQHSGIDLKSTMRAAVFLGSKGGASTLTQQLAKQFFTKRSRNFVKRVWQKMKEWAIAIEFERRYTKGEILAMYVNKFDFLNSSNGISAAANTYFGKNQKDLDVSEAAVLVAMFKNPHFYNPKYNPENSLKRRNVVLKQMVKNNYCTQKEYEENSKEVIDMSNFKRAKNYDGPAPYFRAELTKMLKDLFNDDKIRKPDGSKYNIYTDGLQVFTTIDINMQRHAEASMKEHMKVVQGNYFDHWKNKDPWTYDADKAEKKIRKDDLNKKIENSERFQTLKAAMMNENITKAIDEIPDARFNIIDIKRMLYEDSGPGFIAGAVNKGYATKDQAAVYKKIMRSSHWENIKSDWKKLQQTVKTVFNKPVKMKVFAYNDEGSKMATMTPLDSIKYHSQHLQFGSLSIDPKTGFIRSWVGGIGYDYFKYDHIQQSQNQIGSTFKPFIYTAAIEKYAMSPCQKVQDIQYEIPAGDPDFKLEKTWRPSNSKDFTGEFITLKEGLRQSKNSVSVYLMKQLQNVEIVRDFVAQLGIDKDKIPPYPSICLGTPDLSVMDMAGAYTSYANNGIYSKPIFVREIKDKNGKVIYRYQPEQRRALNPKYNHAMVDMLKNVVQNKAHLFKSEIAGKTGTTNDHVDGWFVGFTPELVTATWVGGSERWIRFRNISLGQGAVMARPYFVKLLQRIEADKRIPYDETARFVVPEGDLIMLDCNKYELLAQALKKEDKKKKDEFEEEF